MSSVNERRENGDGSYSANVALTDVDGFVQVDLRDHGMVGTSPLFTKGYTAQAAGHAAVSIRDTANYDIVVDTALLTGEKMIVVTTTLNQPLTLTAYAEGTGYTFAIMATKGSITTGAVVVTSATSVDWGALKAPAPKIRLRLAAGTAPTSGSVSSYIEGVQA